MEFYYYNIIFINYLNYIIIFKNITKCILSYNFYNSFLLIFVLSFIFIYLYLFYIFILYIYAFLFTLFIIILFSFIKRFNFYSSVTELYMLLLPLVNIGGNFMIGRVDSGKVLPLIIIFNILFFVNYIKILPLVASMADLACSLLILVRILRIYIFILFLVNLFTKKKFGINLSIKVL